MTSDRRIARGLFVLTLVAYAWFFNGAGWNANAQFDLTRAVVEQHSLAIDAYQSNTGDVSFAGGHVYSNKPPGVSFLAMPPYAIAYAVERATGVDTGSAGVQLVNLWLLTLLVCGVSGAFIAPVLYSYGRRIGVDRPASLGVAIAIALGTYVYAYSTVFFAHVPAALFCLLAFAWADERPLLAGVAAGLAGACFYLAIPFAAVLAAAVFLRSRRAGVRFVLGGLPFGALLLLYQFALFGSALTTPPEQNARFTQEGAWLGLFVAPRVDVLWDITFSRFRGLFYLSPILLVALAGSWVMLRTRVMRRELAIVGVTFALMLLANASFNGWHGGSAIGPRYILHAVPLLGVPMMFAWNGLRAVRAALLVWSMTVALLVAAVNPTPSRFIDDPVGSYVVPLFVTGHLPASVPAQPLFSWKVMLGHVSVNAHAPDERYPFTRHRPGSPIARWASFNIGETVAENSPASVLPIAIWIVMGSLWLWRKATESPLDEGNSVP